MSEPNFKLGDRVKDIYTGFTGTLCAWTRYLHGCDRVTIEPDELDKDGKLKDAYHFDVMRVELVESRPVKISTNPAAAQDKRPGGPVTKAERR